MAADPVSARYAEALFEFVHVQGRSEAMLAQLERLAELAAHQELRKFLGNPDVEADEKVGVLSRLMKDGWSKDLDAFVRVVLSLGRADALIDIVEEFRSLVDAQRHVVRVTVRTAHPLTDELRQRVAQWVAKHEGGTPALTEQVDPALLGGIQLLLDHRIFDGSIATQLGRLRQRLKRVRVN